MRKIGEDKLHQSEKRRLRNEYNSREADKEIKDFDKSRVHPNFPDREDN